MANTVQLAFEVRWSDTQDAGARGGFTIELSEADARKRHAKVAGRPDVARVAVRLIEKDSGCHVRDIDTSDW